MLLLLLLPILVSGFYLCIKHPRLFYKLHRYEGQQLYLSAAYHGFTTFILSSIVVGLSKELLPPVITICDFQISLNLFNLLNNTLSKAFGEEQSKTITWLSILSIAPLVIAIIRVKLWTFIVEKILPKDFELKVFLMGTILNDSPLDSILFESYISNKPTLLTLSNRKVYVGFVVNMGEPNESNGLDQEIAILPIMSGYRKVKNSMVKYTTSYTSTQKPEKIVIRQALIETATLFDEKVHSHFQESSKQK